MVANIVIGLLCVIFGIPLLFVIGIVIILAFIGIWESFWGPILHGKFPWDDPPSENDS